jgi:erythromycin esterase-like protein
MSKSCEQEVVKVLLEMHIRSMNEHRDAFVDTDELFYAKLNAKVVAQAEKYYRKMFRESKFAKVSRSS